MQWFRKNKLHLTLKTCRATILSYYPYTQYVHHSIHYHRRGYPLSNPPESVPKENNLIRHINYTAGWFLVEVHFFEAIHGPFTRRVLYSRFRTFSTTDSLGEWAELVWWNNLRLVIRVQHIGIRRTINGAVGVIRVWCGVSHDDSSRWCHVDDGWLVAWTTNLSDKILTPMFAPVVPLTILLNCY